MAPVKAPVFELLFDPEGVVTRDATASATADRSKLYKVTFDFPLKNGPLVLHTSELEAPDTWCVRPIEFFPELACVHYPHVLIRIRSTDSRRYPTNFYVYRFPSQQGARHTVVKLPKVAPEIWTSKSFGLVHVHRKDTYMVTNLQMERNQVTKQVEVFLHRLWCSGLSWHPKLKVTLPSDMNIDLWNWQTDQVVTFVDALLWVDLRQGVILRCKNPSQTANFEVIYLPYMKRVTQPRTFMSVGCCKGELKLVEIAYGSDVNAFINVTVMTFNEQSYKKCSNKSFFRKYWDPTSVNSKPLICSYLLADMMKMPAFRHLEASEHHMPCFPFLSAYKNHILHLIMARKDKMGAWLLHFNTLSWALEDAAAYNGFSKHQRPPY